MVEALLLGLAAGGVAALTLMWQRRVTQRTIERERKRDA